MSKVRFINMTITSGNTFFIPNEAIQENVIYLEDDYSPILEESNETESCNHTWKNYAGLFESYEYCGHCDEKRDKT